MDLMHMAATAASVVLLAAPVAALASSPHSNHHASNPHANNVHQTPTSPGDTGSSPAGRAYGRDCQGESKHHVAGQHGTPFSACVIALSRLDSGQATNPARACKGLSKKHVRGEKGTPFSRCVSAAAKLRRHHHPTGATGPTGPTGPTGASGPTGDTGSDPHA